MATTEEERSLSFYDTLDLSSLFSNCIESLGLILPFHENKKSESLLLAKVAIQQARLLCWGDVLGVTSPPAASGITMAVPKHAGLTNPDPTQPIIFGSRDPRLDEKENRRRINDALHGIMDPVLQPNHTELRKTYGFRHFKGGRFTEQPLLSILRLEVFREKVSLLEEVTHNFESPDLPRKKHRTLMPRWWVEDANLFGDYLQVVTQNVDWLINFMDVQPQVDKSMKMDIRAMGWHPSDLQVDIARMAWKLGIIREASTVSYPEYSAAAKEAMDNTLGVWKGDHSYTCVNEHNPVIGQVAMHTSEEAVARLEALKAEKEAKTGVFAFAPKFLRKKSEKRENRRKSYNGASLHAAPDAQRSSSMSTMGEKARESLDTPRRSSVHALTEKEISKSRAGEDAAALAKVPTNTSTISRHDMYRGVFRIQTKK